MKLMRTPLFWIIFTIFAGSCGFLGRHYFSQAFPIVNIDLTMNRTHALREGKLLAQQFNLGPIDAEQASLFWVDETVKTFVELDAGGKGAFSAMMKENLYQPYAWQVRRFKQFDPHQVAIRFNPDGTPYGFKETLSENSPGAQLDKNKAEALARAFAQSPPWNINFDTYTLVEASQEKQPSKRIDHIFLFERSDAKIGDGFYRLRIRVSGDKVSELVHFVQVPEAFTQKYSAMRSANENIAYAAKLALMIVYVIGGCLFGLFFLLRERRVIWKMPLVWAAIIAGMATLQAINELPIAWMSYNTAFSTTGFLMQQIVNMLMIFIYWLFILFISFAAAESLTRQAFGNQLQLWRLWNTQVASSLAVLGRTIAGYLLVPVLLAFIVCFYIYTTTYFGWWTPSSALFNPNILATYVPWWESIAISLRAGFWEECLFRAVPLASAALLGARYGKRNWWIAGAFILQALIFGAAHANYPAQPAYARVIELLAVSSLFGGVYLRFGLLPAIITHFAYDVMWFSLPIFISTAPNAFFNKVMVLLATLIPLWIVLWKRCKAGKWFALPKTVYNFSWKAPAHTPHKKLTITKQTSVTIAPPIVYGYLLAGLIALGAWGMFTQFTSDALPFTTQRTQALKNAQHLLEEKNITVTDWYPMVSAFTTYEQTDVGGARQRFVWQEANQSIYRALMGTYLSPPTWQIRFVKFNGSLADRAEEHRILLKPDGSFYRYTHVLPENRPGESLNKSDARAIAFKEIATQYDLAPNQLSEISAIAQKNPNRLDWVFTFEVPTANQMSSGQARIEVAVRGNQVADMRRYMHIPEAWQRADENKQLMSTIIKQLCGLCIYLLFIFGSLYAFMHWRVPLRKDILLPFTTAIAAIFLFELANSWPAIIAYFTTSQPFIDQLFRSYAIQAISLCMRAGLLGLLFAFIISWRNRYRITLALPTVYGIGTAIGITVAAALSMIESAIFSAEPLWANYTPLRFALPLNAGINSYLINYISITILVSLILIVLNTLTERFTQAWLPALLLVFFGFIIMGLAYGSNPVLWLAASAVLSAIYIIDYFLIARYCPAIIPSAVAGYYSLYALQQIYFNAMPHALIINAISIFFMGMLGWLWSKKMLRN